MYTLYDRLGVGGMRVYLQILGSTIILYVFKGKEYDSAIYFRKKFFFVVSTQKNYRHLALFHQVKINS